MQSKCNLSIQALSVEEYSGYWFPDITSSSTFNAIFWNMTYIIEHFEQQRPMCCTEEHCRAQQGAFSFFDSLRTTASQTHQIMIIVIGYDRSSKFFLSGCLSGTRFLNLLLRAEGHKISILSFHLKISKEKLLQWHQRCKYPSMNFPREVKTCREGFIPEINTAFLSPRWDTRRMDNSSAKGCNHNETEA